MIKLAADKILQVMLNNEMIEEADLEIYNYGFQMMLLKLFHFCIIFVIGFVLGITLEVIVFILCYSLLRTYTGGYHANSSLACFAISIFMVIVIWGTYERILPILTIVLSIIASIVILRLSPVASDISIVNEDEMKKNKCRSVQITSMLVICFMLASLFHMKFIYISIFYSLFFCSLFLVISKRNS